MSVMDAQPERDNDGQLTGKIVISFPSLLGMIRWSLTVHRTDADWLRVRLTDSLRDIEQDIGPPKPHDPRQFT